MVLFLLPFLILISKSSQFIVAPSNITKSEILDKDDGKSSLVFVFDTTGSMYNDLRQLRAGAEMILKTALEESNVIADFVFVPFHDPAIGPATVTRNKEVFKAALQIVHVYGGGDCPEKSLGGILLALNVSRPQSFVYVFTDATASDHKLVGTVLDAVQRKQSQVVFVLTGHCNDLHKPTFKVYEQIAAASSGQIFNLNKTNVHNVLDFVRTSIKGRSVNLASAINPPGYNYTQNIPVDKTVNEVTVSVSGAKPQIHVVNPSGEEITGPPQLVTTLDLSEIMIVKVLEPEAGQWSIRVGSTGPHSVRVVGLSDLTFAHGFAAQRPASMTHTGYRPLKGTYNHMMISLSKTNVSTRVNFAEILNLEGKTLFEVPLKKLEDGLYVADAFLPPDDLFYVSINGVDENGQEFRRVGTTAVQAKLPDAPYLVVPQKIQAHYHERIVLTCHVESLVPVTAAWYRDTHSLHPMLSSLQSTSVEYEIADVVEADVGQYRCEARNAAGQTDAGTTLELIVEPPQVTVLPVNTSIAIHEGLTLTCSVLSEALLHSTQIIFNGTLHDYALDFKIEPNVEGIYTFNKTINSVSERDEGLYTCLARNRGGVTNTSTHITVQSHPLVQILGPHTLTKPVHTDAQFVCYVENALEMHWLDQNGGELDRVVVNGSYNSVLEVKNLTEDGVWTCVASRHNYTAKDTIAVKLLIKPEVKIEGSINITILNGTTAHVTCTVRAKPEPRILWHMETERFLEHNVTKISTDTYKSILTIDSTKEPINGTYFCYGENSEGIDQDSITVQVRRKMTLVDGFTDRAVELYSQVELPCKVDSYPPPKISWYHNTTIPTNSTNIEDNSTIYLRRVDFNDLGMYSCIADNGYEHLVVNGTLSVHGLETPLISKELAKKYCQKGNSTVLTCRLLKGKPEPTITWQHKSSTTSNFTSLPSDVLVDNDVVISSVTIDNAGIYRCVAENVLGKDEYDVELVMQYPPELISPDLHIAPMDVKLGQSITLVCNATGSPTPVVVWTKDHQPIVYSRNVYLREDNELIIANATQYESGLFSCKAVSTLGSVERNFTVNVYEAPVIHSTAEQEVELLEGQLVELPCSARGLPAPVVRWLQNGHSITERRKHVDEYGLRFVANLTDFGEYTCVASNVHGSTNFNYTLYVWVAPSIDPPLEELKNVLDSSNITFNCDAVGFPVPAISWEFNGERLLENTTRVSFNNVGSLYITNVSSDDVGDYLCVAESFVGVDVKRFVLAVNEPPRIISDNLKDYIGIEGRDTTMTLACKATGKPRPYVVWMKDGYYLDRDSRYDIDDEGRLTINLPAVEMSGNYTCIAKNDVGNVTLSVQVNIYPLPMPQSDETLTKVTLIEGQAGEVECPVMHAHEVKWYKDATLISKGSLQFPNVSRSHSATYDCVVSNTVGSARSRVSLQVVWPPTYLAEVDTRVEVVRGGDCYLDCGADAKPKAKTKWLFNSNVLLGQDRDKLKLMNVQRHSGGLYRCIVSNEYGTVYRDFTLSVLIPPQISEYDVLDVHLQDGTNATLECNARGLPAPNVTWTYNNTYWSPVNASVISTKVSPQSKGTFRCTATNKAGVAHLVYNVTVVSIASIKGITMFKGGEGSDAEGSVDVVLNTTIRIACGATGIPPPTIQWFRNGNKISQNIHGVHYADLTFDNVAISQAGSYTCVVVNEAGMDERQLKINVLEPPRIFKTLFQNDNPTDDTLNLDVISEQSFFMHCHAFGHPMPEIYWFKDGVPLRFFDDSMVSKEFGEIIAVKRASEEHSGNYTCVARNGVGETSVVYLVDVMVAPPQLKDNTKHISTRIGNLLNLTCPVVGKPSPYVSWLKHPYTVISETDRMHMSSDNYTLLIYNTEVLDTGKYSCIMTNKVGSTEVIFDVIIEKPPSVVHSEGDDTTEKHVVPLRRGIVLKCEVDGNPAPRISWLKDIQKLNDNLPNIQNFLSTSLLTIWSAETRDAGQYICVAENAAGTAHRRYNLIVKVPGKWSRWSQWGYCNATCGRGAQMRSRSCLYVDDYNNTYDKSSHTDKVILDESDCKGAPLERRQCQMPPCEDDVGGWSRWSRWSRCSASCGGATQARSRRCRHAHTRACAGDNVQIRKCRGLPPCRVHRKEHLDSDVVSSSGTDGDDDAISDYLPEATFENGPEDVSPYSSQSANVEFDDYYTAPSMAPERTIYYDVKVTENLDRSERGPCKAGFRHNRADNTCLDVDECNIPSNKCHSTQVCSNTAGGYRCACPPGFRSPAAGQRCLDINECALNLSGCQFACVNVAGGYVCACPKHLRLHVDRHRCVPPSEYNKPRYSYEDFDTQDYLSTSLDYPAR